MTDRDQRIREIAYFLWLEEGSPEGEADRHWLAAEGLIEDEPLEGRSRRKRAFGQAQKALDGDSRVGLTSNRFFERRSFGSKAFAIAGGSGPS